MKGKAYAPNIYHYLLMAWLACDQLRAYLSVKIMSLCSTINHVFTLGRSNMFLIWWLINPLETAQHFNSQFVVPVPWKTIFILDPKSKQDKVKATNLKNLPKVHFCQFRLLFHATHLLMLVDDMYKYETDPASIAKDTGGQGETSIPQGIMIFKLFCHYGQPLY